MIRENVDLLDPEAVKLFIKKYKKWSDGHKMVAAYAYNDFCKMLNIEWEVPTYRWKETIPFVPTKKEVEALIAGTSKKVSITLQGLKETGFRIGELWDCKWTDLDEEKCTIKCQGEKH
jgi:integrase